MGPSEHQITWSLLGLRVKHLIVCLVRPWLVRVMSNQTWMGHGSCMPVANRCVPGCVVTGGEKKGRADRSVDRCLCSCCWWHRCLPCTMFRNTNLWIDTAAAQMWVVTLQLICSVWGQYLMCNLLLHVDLLLKTKQDYTWYVALFESPYQMIDIFWSKLCASWFHSTWSICVLNFWMFMTVPKFFSLDYMSCRWISSVPMHCRWDHLSSVGPTVIGRNKRKYKSEPSGAPSSTKKYTMLTNCNISDLRSPLILHCAKSKSNPISRVTSLVVVVLQ